MIWTRNNTKDWISKLETRIEDIQFYLTRTIEWCEEHEIYSDRSIFVCSVMALVWVSHLRKEPIHKQELFEILGIENWAAVDDAVFEFNAAYENMELEELLQFVAISF